MNQNELNFPNGRENLTINQIKDKLIQFIKDKCQNSKICIGLSGGIDSSITLYLAREALGKENVNAIIIKNTRFHDKHLYNAIRFANRLDIRTIIVDLSNMVNTVSEVLDLNDEIELSTLDGRINDLVLKTVAKKHGFIILGTINATERLSGWYPKGALTGDYCPIAGLYKTDIKHLCQELGFDELCQTISTTADRICSGCGTLSKFRGIPYETLDLVLMLYEKYTDIGEFTEACQDYDLEQEMVNKIVEHVKLNNHKTDVFPSYLKID